MEIDKKRIFQITAKLGLAVIIVPVLFLVYTIFVPVDSSASSEVEVVVAPGDGLNVVAETLKSKSLIRSTLAFRLYALAIGQDKGIKAGRYLLSPAVSAKDILGALVSGLAESDDIQITVPEGSNTWEIDKVLLSVNLIEKAGDFVRTQQKNEGYLFPDTYRFDKDLAVGKSKQNNPDLIARVMMENFRKKVGTVDPKIVIIASMLEKEAKTESDMEIVSGIIKNRMDIGMLLQIDATVGYGWCLKALAARKYTPSCDVAQAPIAFEIAEQGLYNSYIQKDLPPGPISNPGLVALESARNPKDSDYFYYLSTRDGSQIIYSKTAAEHAQNRRKYLGL